MNLKIEGTLIVPLTLCTSRDDPLNSRMGGSEKAIKHVVGSRYMFKDEGEKLVVSVTRNIFKRKIVEFVM